MRRSFRLIVAMSLALVGGGMASTAAAQEPPPPVPDTMPVADTIPTELPSPRGAFLRALTVPGWGHFYSGSYVRGSVYASLQGGSWFMLIKTLKRLDEAQDREDLLTRLATDSLNALIAVDTMIARILSDPEAFRQALLTYPGLRDTRLLVRAREQQRQDWITYTLFFTFAAAVDAYVTAHLKDFPGEITARPVSGGGMELRMGIPLGGRP